MKIAVPIFIVICVMIMGCKKDLADSFKSTYDTDVSKSAKLKVNFASVYRSNPGFRIKINETIVSSNITARTPYPGGGFNTLGNSMGDYLAVPIGESKIKMVMVKVGTDIDSAVLYESSISLNDNNYYTLHVTDTAASIKSVIFQEDLSIESPASLPKFKLVNLMPNVAAVDLYFGPTLVASNISYLNTSPEFTIDTSQTNRAWVIRAAGSGSTGATISTYTSGSTLNPGRKYTGFAMGYRGITSTTDPRRPFISFFYTR